MGDRSRTQNRCPREDPDSIGSLLAFFEVAHVVIAIGERYEHTVNHPNPTRQRGILANNVETHNRNPSLTQRVVIAADAQLQNWRFGFVKAVNTALSN